MKEDLLLVSYYLGMIYMNFVAQRTLRTVSIQYGLLMKTLQADIQPWCTLWPTISVITVMFMA